MPADTHLAPSAHSAPPESESCSLLITIYISPDNVKAWFDAFRPVYEACVAEAECSFFSVYQDPEDPGKISWVEHW
jgi:quinol monooxygenase YgiN